MKLTILLISLFFISTASTNNVFNCKAVDIEKPPYPHCCGYGGRVLFCSYHINITYKFYHNSNCDHSNYIELCDDVMTERECYIKFKKEYLNDNTTCTVKKGSCKIIEIGKNTIIVLNIIGLILIFSLIFVVVIIITTMCYQSKYDSID